MCTDETLRVEIVFYSGIAPVNGDGVDMEGIDQFFRSPTRVESVFEGEVEPVIADPINFALVAVFLGYAESGVVEGGTRRVNFPAAVEDAEELLTFLGGVVGIGTKQGAEVRLGGTDRNGVRNGGTDQFVRHSVEGVDRKIIRPGIFHQMRDDSVVALLPVRSVELLGPVDLHPVLQAVLVADMAVDDEFCRIVPAKVKVGGKKLGEKSSAAFVEVAVSQGDRRLHDWKNSLAFAVRSSRGRRKASSSARSDWQACKD